MESRLSMPLCQVGRGYEIAEVFSESDFIEADSSAQIHPENGGEDLSWDGILEDDLKTLRELIDKTKRSEEEHG